MTLLAYYPNQWCSSAIIADSLKINSALVRKELKALRDYDLIQSKEGKNGGVKLSVSATKITLGDIFRAVKGSSHVLNLSNNVPDVSCKIGGQINDKLIDMFEDIDNAIIHSLNRQTLEEFKNQF